MRVLCAVVGVVTQCFKHSSSLVALIHNREVAPCSTELISSWDSCCERSLHLHLTNTSVFWSYKTKPVSACTLYQTVRTRTPSNSGGLGRHNIYTHHINILLSMPKRYPLHPSFYLLPLPQWAEMTGGSLFYVQNILH